jgi:hypothetical protein
MQRIQSSFGAAFLIGAIMTMGCNEQPTTQASPINQSAQGSKRSQEVALVIPAGTSVLASLQTPLDTGTNQSGDSFRARTLEPTMVDGRTLVPAGAEIHGVLHDVQASGRVKGRAAMTLAFTEIEDTNGVLHAISARPLTLQADSGTRGDVEKMAAGGVLGAIIGGIADGGKGAAIGAGAGVGAGVIVMLATKGDEVALEVGQKLNVYTTSPTSIVLVAAQ